MEKKLVILQDKAHVDQKNERKKGPYLDIEKNKEKNG